MARPLKLTVDYFPHFSTGGKTLFILQSKFGNDGYAFWFKLLELLASSEGHCYDYNNATDWSFLLAKTCVNEDTAINILNILIEVDAIDPDLASKKIIWSQNFVNNISDAYKRRQIGLPQRPGTNHKTHNPDTDWAEMARLITAQEGLVDPITPDEAREWIEEGGYKLL